MRTSCVIDRDLSIVEDKPLRYSVELPVAAPVIRVALRRPILAYEVECSPDWLEVVQQRAADKTLLLRLGSIEVAGTRTAMLKIPLAGGCYEKVSLELEATTRHSLRPERLSLSTHVGESRALAVELVGGRKTTGAGHNSPEIEWQPEFPPRGEHRQFRIALLRKHGFKHTASEEPEDSDDCVQLELKIHAGAESGLFKGRFLVGPAAARGAKLALPYIVRVARKVRQPDAGHTGRSR
ncbi:MAG: hypothetical protein ACE5F1_06950 [Planctomycetota bacterium]